MAGGNRLQTANSKGFFFLGDTPACPPFFQANRIHPNLFSAKMEMGVAPHTC